MFNNNFFDNLNNNFNNANMMLANANNIISNSMNMINALPQSNQIVPNFSYLKDAIKASQDMDGKTIYVGSNLEVKSKDPSHIEIINDTNRFNLPAINYVPANFNSNNNMVNNYNYQISNSVNKKENNKSKKHLFTIDNFAFIQQSVTNEINSIINFVLRYFEFQLDDKGFICIDVSPESDIEILQRVKLGDKFLNINKEYMKSKSVIYFNPVVNLSLTRFIFDLFLQRARIETFIFYISNNILYLKDINGKIFYNSIRYNFNTNLCYLDIIFRLNCIDIDLSRWDVDNYVEVLI